MRVMGIVEVIDGFGSHSESDYASFRQSILRPLGALARTSRRRHKQHPANEHLVAPVIAALPLPRLVVVGH